MADWSYGVNDAATVKLWSARLFKQSITRTIAWRLANISSSVSSEENIVQILDDTLKGPGDNITYDLISKLNAPGVIGDDTLAGQEEALTTYTTSITINQLRNAVLIRGAMSQQRVPINMRDTARVRLGDWWQARHNISLINQLTGNTAQADVRYTGLNATVAPDAEHIIYGGNATSDGTLNAGDEFTLDLIDEAVYIAHTNNVPIKPIQLKGMEINGVVLIHPLQTLSLRTNYTAGQWGDIQLAAMKGSEISGNPIFTGAIGMYNGVVIHEDAMMPYGTGAGTGHDAIPGQNLFTTANVARAVFCGAQAACFAFGRAYNTPNKIKWFEELLDGGNQLRVTAGQIFAMKKNRFNNADYATVAIDTFQG